MLRKSYVCKGNHICVKKILESQIPTLELALASEALFAARAIVVEPEIARGERVLFSHVHMVLGRSLSDRP